MTSATDNQVLSYSCHSTFFNTREFEWSASEWCQALIDTAWFVLQLVARYIQNLPMTLLELDTLAVVALTCIAYGFWWKKPKDVGRPYAVYWKATTSLPSTLAYDVVDPMFSTEKWFGFCYLTFIPFSVLRDFFPSIPPVLSIHVGFRL
ncbi:hypothetical protein DFJ58DRAFT_461194 [Suillus subalutaceus]|uniref:uncharacterized protein n=1 Tax=Suillus subalutaceus TaxID=48586 RepID=UPI001B8681A5|nr:uncharacterized protein DFJ58DRAFT_461194 [Suillus subalutaceus]KAG1848941.1 hypothetical protein DFJ58DRAFT_461194 [Suillus subalutaceus]